MVVGELGATAMGNCNASGEASGEDKQRRVLEADLKRLALENQREKQKINLRVQRLDEADEVRDSYTVIPGML